MSYKKPLTVTLWLMALHSIGVGLGMIIFPIELIAYFDIVPSEHRFFITQGGVFHIVMAVAYFMAAVDINKNEPLIKFSIIVKLCATIFLIGYFIFVNHFILVLGSGIVDMIMGIVLLLSYNKFKKLTIQ